MCLRGELQTLAHEKLVSCSWGPASWVELTQAREVLHNNHVCGYLHQGPKSLHSSPQKTRDPFLLSPSPSL